MFLRLWGDIIYKNNGESKYQPKKGSTGYLDQESEMPEGPAFIAGTLPSPDGRKWLMFEIKEDNGTKIPCVIHERYTNQAQPNVMAFCNLYDFPNGGSPVVKYETVAGKNIKLLIDGGKISNKGKKISLTKKGKNFWKSKSIDNKEELISIIKAQQSEIERLQQLVIKNSISKNKSKGLTVQVSKKKEELSWPPNEKYFKSMASAGFEHLEKKSLDNITVLTYFKNDASLIIFDPKYFANTKYITKEFFNKDKTKSVVVMIGEID